MLFNKLTIDKLFIYFIDSGTSLISLFYKRKLYKLDKNPISSGNLTNLLEPPLRILS